MISELYLIDAEGAEIPGTRRTVDFDADREGYFAAKDELERGAPEGGTVIDTALR